MRPHSFRVCFALVAVPAVFAACRGSSSGPGVEAIASTSGGASTAGIGGGSTVGGDGGGEAHETPLVTPVAVVGGDGNRYTFVGRFDMANPNAPRFSFLGSKIGVQFTGTSLAVSVADTGYDYFNAVIDGGPAIIVPSQPSTGPQTLPIASNLPPGKHTAWLSKRTEASQRDKVDTTRAAGVVTFNNFVLGPDGAFLSAPAPKPRLIEALGDSGCTGYGVDQLMHNGADACNYTLATQNADATVFAFAAQACDAEVVNLSASGRGIYDSQYNPNNLKSQLSYVYQMTIAPNAQPAWGFTGYTPDVVVINGGGDDVFGESGRGAFPDPAAILSTYTQLLANIRSHYPKALIVAAIGAGAFGQDKVTISTAIQQAIAARAAAGDTNVTFFDYFNGSPNGWSSYSDAAGTFFYGCEYHASAAGSKFLGDQLATFLKAKLGW
jgi:lysophospholipase L1-like esterase